MGKLLESPATPISISSTTPCSRVGDLSGLAAAILLCSSTQPHALCGLRTLSHFQEPSIAAAFRKKDFLKMETEDVISLPASSSPANGSDNNELNDTACQPSKANCQSLDVQEVNANGSHGSSGNVADEDNELLLAADNDVVENQHSLEVSAEAGLVQDGSGLCNHAEDGFLVSSQETRANSLSGVKRPREAVDEQQPSVQVTYNSLTRDSKRKLEELLQHWSQWHTQNCSSSNDLGGALESGEETYFPALQVGLDKPSAMSFWMETETRSGQNKGLIRFDGNSVPLYDRGYSLALTSADDSNSLEGVREVVGDCRCFNCGSYNHSLKDCPKPRDNVAVNNARKQHKSRRNQNAAARNPTRYYQNTPGGKYDGLKPGTLDAETRKALGLGELDPPPWLNRMREIGYPPGYLEVDDQPSGITIFGAGESREETEEGEILETSSPDAPKKMSVEFPGVNAPIPENADEERWAAGSSDLRLSRNHSYSRYHRPTDPISRGRYHEQRWSRDFEDDEPPPPGCDPESLFSSSYSRRYGSFESGYTSRSPRDNPTVPRNSSFGRSLSDRSRRGPLVHDDSPRYHSHRSFPYPSPR